MKKWLVLAALLALGGGGYLVAAHLSGGAFWAFGLPLGGDRGELRRTALQFLEDIQFKDFVSAAQYHDEATRDTVDIPFLLQRLFAVKPELLDIMDYEVVFADLDSSGNRARVKMRIKAKLLLNDELKERPLMLYFSREHREAPWHMKLEDSLRDLEKEQGKKG